MLLTWLPIFVQMQLFVWTEGDPGWNHLIKRSQEGLSMASCSPRWCRTKAVGPSPICTWFIGSRPWILGLSTSGWLFSLLVLAVDFLTTCYISQLPYLGWQPITCVHTWHTAFHFLIEHFMLLPYSYTALVVYTLLQVGWWVLLVHHPCTHQTRFWPIMAAIRWSTSHLATVNITVWWSNIAGWRKYVLTRKPGKPSLENHPMFLPENWGNHHYLVNFLLRTVRSPKGIRHVQPTPFAPPRPSILVGPPQLVDPNQSPTRPGYCRNCPTQQSWRR